MFDITIKALDKLKMPTMLWTDKTGAMRCFGFNCDKLPLSLDDAVSGLTKVIEIGGGHIHLHIHEHTHDEVKKWRDKYG